jgi:peroxiredoxin
MTRTTIALTALAFVGSTGTVLADDGSAIALGAKAPMADVKMKSATDGKEVSIATVSGKKGTLVVFTCNHCPYAKNWEERIVTLGHTYSKKGVGVILINSNDPSIAKGDSYEDMQQRVKERGMKVPYAVDEKAAIARAFGATKTPEAFVFDKAGKLVYHGTIDNNHQDPSKVTESYLKEALEAVVVGKTPPVQQTKSLGCTIKFPKVS